MKWREFYKSMELAYISQMCQPPGSVQSQVDPFVTNEQHLIKVHYKLII